MEEYSEETRRLLHESDKVILETKEVVLDLREYTRGLDYELSISDTKGLQRKL